jgi:peroxiredoxin Q/BCP
VLKAGAIAPSFIGRTTRGGAISLASLSSRILVLYFFRKAFTRNCTVETKGFRDNYDELVALGAEVVGISCDDLPTQCRFAEAHQVRFAMIADHDRVISKTYDVFFPLLPVSHRVTYVIGRDGVIAGVFKHEFAVVKHLDEVVRFVRQLARPQERPVLLHPHASHLRGAR